MRRGDHNGLSRSRFVLRKDIHQVTEMTGKLPGTHGSPHFKRALERDRLYVEPFLLKEPFVDSHIEHDGVGRGQRGNTKRLRGHAGTARTKQAAEDRFECRLHVHG